MTTAVSTGTRFPHFPTSPTHKPARSAFLILSSTHLAATSFLDTFESLRGTRGAKGTPTDEEQDLLRAMLLFASAGLDSMVKQLVRDTLPAVIGNQPGASENFRDFIERRIVRQDILDRKLLASVLTHRDPRSVMIGELIRELTSSSLQSRDQLLKVAAFFDIPSRALCDDMDDLKRIFDSRNQIAHEMDIDFSQPNRRRRPRKKKQMIDDTSLLFLVSNNFLRETDARL